MSDQQNNQPSSSGYQGIEAMPLGPELIQALSSRPLTARELVQWLGRCLEQAADLRQLQWIADNATGVMHALHLCWLISAEESKTLIAELNTVYAARQRELSGAVVH